MISQYLILLHVVLMVSAHMHRFHRSWRKSLTTIRLGELEVRHWEKHFCNASYTNQTANKILEEMAQ